LWIYGADQIDFSQSQAVQLVRAWVEPPPRLMRDMSMCAAVSRSWRYRNVARFRGRRRQRGLVPRPRIRTLWSAALAIDAGDVSESASRACGSVQRTSDFGLRA